MVAVKICGITSPKEIEYLNQLKPEYIGFVFTKSKRQISAIEAKSLKSKLDNFIKTVGVFRNNSIDEILDVLSIIDLDVIQLHGDEDKLFILKLREKLSSNIKVWKAISLNKNDNLNKYLDYNIDAFLLDSINPGSGETFEWKCVDISGLKEQLILAGGINLNNVLEGIRIFNPDIIDVSSSVEEINSSGIRLKSFEKMKSLIKKVRDKDER